MRATSRFAAAFSLAAACLTGVDAIQKVTRNGRYLYTADGNRFYIKGIAYQEQGKLTSLNSTPFVFTAGCRCGGRGPEQSFP